LSPTSSDTPKSLDVTTGAPDVHELDVGILRVSHARFPGGQILQPHYHPRACVSMILEGAFSQRFPGRVFECGPGAVLVKPPEETHQDRWADRPARHLIIEPDPAQHDRLGDLSGLVEEVSFRSDPGLHALGLRIIHEMDIDDPARCLAVQGLALELLARFSRVETGEAGGGEPPAWLQRIRDLVSDRFRENLTLEELGAAAGVHPTHVSRTFSRYYGVGVASYMRRLRVEAAREELRTSDTSISRVALRNGFSDQSHLTRELRRAIGVTPAQYRALTAPP